MEFRDSRYNRQELMPQVGRAGQELLAASSIVVIGAGGVKACLLLHLAAMGIGRIRVIDHDRVELSNLNRQILFTTRDIGRSKAIVAGRRMAELNPEIEVDAVDARVHEGSIGSLLAGYDIVVEGGESPEARLLVNDHCLQSRRPMIHPSAQFNYGYVLTVIPWETACFNCVFPDLPAGRGGSVPVIGVATGIAGMFAAGEVLKLVLQQGQPFVNGYMTFSGFQGDFTFVPVPRRDDCTSCGRRQGAPHMGILPG